MNDKMLYTIIVFPADVHKVVKVLPSHKFFEKHSKPQKR